MPVTWAVANRKDAILDVHPEVLIVPGPAGLAARSGAFRAVRCQLTAGGTYAAGGTALDPLAVGLREILGVLVLTDAVPASRSGDLRFNPTTRGLELYVLAGTEHGASAASGVFQVIVFGRT